MWSIMMNAVAHGKTTSHWRTAFFFLDLGYFRRENYAVEDGDVIADIFVLTETEKQRTIHFVDHKVHKHAHAHHANANRH